MERKLSQLATTGSKNCSASKTDSSTCEDESNVDAEASQRGRNSGSGVRSATTSSRDTLPTKVFSFAKLNKAHPLLSATSTTTQEVLVKALRRPRAMSSTVNPNSTLQLTSAAVTTGTFFHEKFFKSNKGSVLKVNRKDEPIASHLQCLSDRDMKIPKFKAHDDRGKDKSACTQTTASTLTNCTRKLAINSPTQILTTCLQQQLDENENSVRACICSDDDDGNVSHRKVAAASDDSVKPKVFVTAVCSKCVLWSLTSTATSTENRNKSCTVVTPPPATLHTDRNNSGATEVNGNGAVTTTTVTSSTAVSTAAGADGGRSHWAKAKDKLGLPSLAGGAATRKAHEVQGIAIQQHARHTYISRTAWSRTKSRRLDRDRATRESYVVLHGRKMVVHDAKHLNTLWNAFPFVYKINDGSNYGSSILQQVCKERGWRECREKENMEQCLSGSSSCASSQQQGEEEFVGRVMGGQSWNLWWRTTTMTPERSSFLQSWQLTNHIPKISTNFSRKDNLARILTRMKSNHAAQYDFSPRCFILPQEYYRLLTLQRNRYNMLYTHLNYSSPATTTSTDPTRLSATECCAKNKKSAVWICKPVCKSQGKGIVVFERVTEFSYDLPSVVQEYIQRPFLINGYKWDLRLYVCITSTSPLTVYAYRGGITRFATNKYDLNDLLNQYAHLTNTSINKQSPEYKKHKDGIGVGCKWTLRKLRSHFMRLEIEDYLLWQKVWSILVLTIIGDAKEITRCKISPNCFEFLGFDVLVDENFKPHLLEVNTNPGLGCDEPTVDESVKKPMLHELFTLLGLPDGRHFDSTSGSNYSNSEEFLYGRSNQANVVTDDGKTLEDLIFGFQEKGVQRSSAMLSPNIGNRNPKNHQSRYYQYHNYRHIKNVIFKELTQLDDFCTDLVISSQDNLQRKDNPYFNIINYDDGRSELHPHLQLEMPVPKMTKNKNKCKLPLKNGPGMTLLVRNWKLNAPKSCGDWVRVFPFNDITREISGEKMDDDDVNEVIYQVNELLKLMRTLVNDSPRKSYIFYNSYIKQFGSINTDIWHPHCENPP